MKNDVTQTTKSNLHERINTESLKQAWRHMVVTKIWTKRQHRQKPCDLLSNDRRRLTSVVASWGVGMLVLGGGESSDWGVTEAVAVNSKPRD